MSAASRALAPESKLVRLMLVPAKGGNRNPSTGTCRRRTTQCMGACDVPLSCQVTWDSNDKAGCHSRSTPLSSPATPPERSQRPLHPCSSTDMDCSTFVLAGQWCVQRVLLMVLGSSRRSRRVREFVTEQYLLLTLGAGSDPSRVHHRNPFVHGDLCAAYRCELRKRNHLMQEGHSLAIQLLPPLKRPHLFQSQYDRARHPVPGGRANPIKNG